MKPRWHVGHFANHTNLEFVVVDLPEGLWIWPRVEVEDNVRYLADSYAKHPLFLDSTPPLAGTVGDGVAPLHDLTYQWEDGIVRISLCFRTCTSGLIV